MPLFKLTQKIDSSSKNKEKLGVSELCYHTSYFTNVQIK